ncbi:HD-GYP domain-containing protein [Quisquiliibacterium transsilvanicum]|uniref:HD-GYP domain-containing protein (C-di-GMP phosphodiesterase class II) n=1 Tax=Quisquiliibacterium transsilvanicum TaxID=1549638 RepID=A0A7W8HKP7_9BURK|nr:HD-GYP domain-containing protein [Quisquiliibacterium transsilvanicum]MBB5273201.1 HD-GYP domain-containing protein (c-di-GMP phosphodiesterase class II) [Quisquiliibacterium transsilvanicum]
MSPETPTRPRTERQHARPLSSQRRLRVAAAHLRLGMFVSDLDRPWSDTPFLIHGFAIDSKIELSTLRRYCRHVHVDLERSTQESADLLRAIGPLGLESGDGAPDTLTDAPDEPAAAAAADGGDTQAQAAGDGPRARAPARTFRARSDVHISRDTRRRFRELVDGRPPEGARAGPDTLAGRALGRIRGLFGAGGERARAGAVTLPRALREELVASLPAGERLRAWPVRHGAREEMPRARQAHARAEKTLGALFEQVRAGNAPRLDQLEVDARHLADSMADNPDALLWVSHLRDELLSAHQQGLRVGLYMAALARRLGLPREAMAQAAMVGMLADIGKTRLPRALLEKPGMLNPAEYGIVKEHVRLGLDLLGAAGGLAAGVARGIAEHHERLDGSGYPKGLGDGAIGAFGRMAAIADSYAGLTMPRAYASPLAPQDALMNLFQWGGSSFDAALVEEFVRAIGVFPVGTLVELSGGEVAVVREQDPQRPLSPRIRLLTWPDRRPLAVSLEVDLPPRARQDATSGPGRIARGLASGSVRINRTARTSEEPSAR